MDPSDLMNGHVQDLALFGGEPVRRLPFRAWPIHAEDEIAAVAEVLRSGKTNYWTGEHAQAFENEFAGFIGSQHALALSSGTTALELALLALGIGAGDEVVIPSKTFIATAGCVVRVGAKPVVADVDPDSQNLTAASIAAVLSARTRAVIAVHLGGWPCEMDEILALARAHSLQVIEDCAQSLGARYRGRMTGSMGTLGAFSFCQDKILSTGGEGGMLVTDDSALLERAWSLKDHGKNYAAARAEHRSPGFRWLHDRFGTNARITEMQSAIGRLQLKKLPQWLSARRQNAAALDLGLADAPGLRLARPPEHLEHAYYRYYAFVRPQTLGAGWSLERILDALSAEGIACGVGACSEVYREQAFAQSGLGPATPLPVASLLADTTLMLQVHPGLGAREMQDSCAALVKVMRAASA